MSPVPLQRPPLPPTLPPSAARHRGKVCPPCPPMARPYVTWPMSGPAHHGVTEPFTFLLSLWVNVGIFNLYLTFSVHPPPHMDHLVLFLMEGPSRTWVLTSWPQREGRRDASSSLSLLLCVNSSYSSGVRSPRLVLKIRFVQSRKLLRVSLWSKQQTAISQGHQQTERLVCLEPFSKWMQIELEQRVKTSFN